MPRMQTHEVQRPGEDNHEKNKCLFKIFCISTIKFKD